MRRGHQAAALITAVLGLAALGGCPPFPVQPCNSDAPCPVGYQCEKSSGLCAQPTVTIRQLRAPVQPVHPGEISIPVLALFVNRSAERWQIQALAPEFEPATAVTAHAAMVPLPQAIQPGGSVELALSFDLAATAEPGVLTVRLRADLQREGDPAILAIGPSPDLQIQIEAGSTADSDGDGISDSVELQLGLDPSDPDSDGDGTDDGAEMVDGQPVDSDGDGLLDMADDDSDDGGEPDILERRRGADPLNPDDDLVYQDLVVNTAVDASVDPGLSERGQAGPELSLREALTIARNRAGPDRISFDPELLPPGTRLTVDGPRYDASSALPSVTDDDTWIEGGDVELVWNGGADNTMALLEISAARAAIRQLTFDVTSMHMADKYPSTLATDGAETTTIARCTFRSDTSWWEGVLMATLLDKNAQDTWMYRSRAVASANGALRYAVRTEGMVGLRVNRCDFTVDGEVLWLSNSDQARIEDNILHGGSWHNLLAYVGNSQFLRNEVGPSGANGIHISGSNNLFEDNVVHDVPGDGIYLDDNNNPSSVTLRRNLIFRFAGEAIHVPAQAQGGIRPPVIDALNGGRVSGHLLEDRGLQTVELFVGIHAQAERFVGQVDITGTSWELDLPDPLTTGEQLRATVTDAEGNSSALSSPWPP